MHADAGKLVVVRPAASTTFYVIDHRGALEIKPGARVENIKRALVVCDQQLAWGDSTTDWDARPLPLPGSLLGCMTRGPDDALLVQRLAVPRAPEAFGLAFHKVTRSGGVDAGAFDKALTDGTHLAPVLLEAEDRPFFDGPYCFIWKETELDVVEMAPPSRTNH